MQSFFYLYKLWLQILHRRRRHLLCDCWQAAASCFIWRPRVLLGLQPDVSNTAFTGLNCRALLLSPCTMAACAAVRCG